MKYKVLKTLRSNEIKPSLWITPVLEQVSDGYRPHHVEVSVGFHTKKFVPIEHVSNHRRRILDLEDENAKLRELAENLLMAFVVLETPKEQQKCIDHAMELRRELNVLPMETFDARKFGIEAD